MFVEKQYRSSIEGMEKYVKKLQTMPEEEAKKLAKENLIKCGVLTRTGKPKNQIVNNR